MLSPEEQTAIDKAAEFVLAFKGKGLTSDEATDMTAKLLGVFMSSAAGTTIMMNAIRKRERP
jgi:hypothetical protein